MTASGGKETVQRKPATVLKHSSGTWEVEDIDPRGLPNSLSEEETYYLFLDKKSYPKSESDRESLLRHFDVPDLLFTETCTDLNGYFGCRGRYSRERKLESYSTWFRCLVKLVQKTEFSESDDTKDDEPEYTKPEKSYIWFEMGIFTRWEAPGRCKVMCIDTPKELQSKLKTALRKQSAPLDFADPFAMHVPLINQIILLYDLSVWRSRHPVRDIEKNRLRVRPDFEKMHDISRHAIHISEVLSVTIDTMDGIRRQHKAIHDIMSAENSAALLNSSADPSPADPSAQTQDYMTFQLQMLKNLKLRSDSNHERLKNEITLAYNIIAGQDNTVMKSIALLTMTFLPATFFSAFFSMTFFAFDDDSWKASAQIWIYLVVTIPTTIIVLAIWSLWLQAQRLKKFFKRKYPAKPDGNSSVIKPSEPGGQSEPLTRIEQARQKEIV